MNGDLYQPNFIFEIKDHTGYILFNRPDVGNSIDSKMAKEMALWTEFELTGLVDRSDVKGLVLKGSMKHFITGADVSEFLKGAGYVEEMTANARKFMRAFHNIALNAVAAVDGYALGGGLEVALGCDYIIATPRSNLGFPEIKFGLIPGAGGTQLLPQRVGYERATEMILTGNLISAQEAFEHGLIDEIVSPDNILNIAAARSNQSNLSGFKFVRLDKTKAHLAIENTYHTIKKQDMCPGPHYAIDAALDCLKASPAQPDYDRETAYFADCIKEEETRKRIMSFLHPND